jgi:hypothetical protein
MDYKQLELVLMGWVLRLAYLPVPPRAPALPCPCLCVVHTCTLRAHARTPPCPAPPADADVSFRSESSESTEIQVASHPSLGRAWECAAGGVALLEVRPLSPFLEMR